MLTLLLAILEASTSVQFEELYVGMFIIDIVGICCTTAYFCEKVQ